MPNALVDWMNARGPVILDRMYDMLPLMVVSAVSAALFVHWVLGASRRDVDGGAPNQRPARSREARCPPHEPRGRRGDRPADEEEDAGDGRR